MCWLENVRVVVMLTKTFENGRVRFSLVSLTFLDEMPQILARRRRDWTLWRRWNIVHADQWRYRTRHHSPNSSRYIPRRKTHYRTLPIPWLAWPRRSCQFQSITITLKRCAENTTTIQNSSCRSLQVHRFESRYGNNFFYSAGIGRTGTYCAVDTVLSKLEEHVKKNISTPFPFKVYETVLGLRGERTGMVQQPVFLKN